MHTFTSTSGSRFIQTVMLRICFGLVLAVLAVAAHKAQSQEGYFAPDVDILTIQSVRSDTNWLIPYRFNANFSFNRPANVTSINQEASSMPQLHLVAEQQPKATVSPTNTGWQVTHESSILSLRPVLRLESKGERLEIKPRLRSISVQWHKRFP